MTEQGNEHVRGDAPPRVPTILIIDDDPVITFLLRSFLEKAGYKCLVARDGDGAWQVLSPDVSLVLQPPLQTSIRNILRAKVAECFDDNGQVEVKLEVGSRTLWARISLWAWDELGIKPGLWLYAQIKSVSITA